MIFTPNSKSFRASPRLCLCDQCKVDYESCSLFNSYELQVQELNQISLRSNIPPLPPPEIVGQEAANEFIPVGSYVAVAAPVSSKDTIWFIKVVEINCVSIEMSKDDYNHEVPKGVIHLSGHFLEKDEKRSSLKSNVFKIASNKKTYFFMESIVYPYVKRDQGSISASVCKIILRFYIM